MRRPRVASYDLFIQRTLEAATARAETLVAAGGIALPQDVSEVETGSPFRIPIVIPEGVESGDGRTVSQGALSLRDLPIPLLWQMSTGDGHDGSVLVGRIDSATVAPGQGVVDARGVFDVGPFAQEAERLVRNGMLRWVSADLDQFEATEDKTEASTDGEPDKVGGDKLQIDNARVMAVTIVSKPAFQVCQIELDDDTSGQQLPDGEYVEPDESVALTAAAAIAASIPLEPPREWFNNPELSHATPLTVSEDGRVFGHVACWDIDHIGLPFGTRPPRSASDYSYFHTGVVRTATGDDVPVGQITLAGGHAPLEASAREALKHYDDTNSAFADVHAGEDAHGIWVAGALRPGVRAEQIRAIRAAAPSGDWRPIRGRLEMVAICQVNVPGFPTARARVASGQVTALVAAGTKPLIDAIRLGETELAERVAALELGERQRVLAARDVAAARLEQFVSGRRAALAAQADEASLRLTELKVRRDAQLAARAEQARAHFEADTDAYVTQFKAFSPGRRESLAKSGKALPDGSYPIENVADLKRAIRAYGRAAESDKAKVRRHVVKRARGLKHPELIPESWHASAAASSSASASELSAEEMDADAYLTEFKDFSPGRRESLAREGKALPDGSYPIESVPDLKRAIKAYGRGNPGDAKKAEIRRHIAKRARGLGVPKLIPEAWSMSEADAEASVEDAPTATTTHPSFASVTLTVGGTSIPITFTATEGDAPFRGGSPDVASADELQTPPLVVDPNQPKYTPKTQPRDPSGKFRHVLAHLRQVANENGLTDIVALADEVGKYQQSDDYEKSVNGAADLISLVDRIKTGAVNADALNTVRQAAKDLGTAIAYLPLAFGQQGEKIRFTDLPPAFKKLVTDMIARVEARIGQQDADTATARLRSFMSGAELESQADISREMSKLLRLLT